MTKKEIQEKARAIVQEHEKYTEDCRINLHLEGGSEVDVARETAYAAAMEMAEWLFSHQWVSVEDELPKDKQNVFIKLASGRSTSGWYSHSIEDWFISVGEIGGDDCLYERVTHWMPIPPLTEEGGEK